LPFEAGKKGAKLYGSADALAKIYETDSLESARVKLALSQAALNEVREQELRKQGIPIQNVLDIMDEVFQSLGATLKAASGKTLTSELINELFDKFRAAPSRLGW
jgi:hypothetical protein